MSTIQKINNLLFKLNIKKGCKYCPYFKAGWPWGESIITGRCSEIKDSYVEINVEENHAYWEDRKGEKERVLYQTLEDNKIYFDYCPLKVIPIVRPYLEHSSKMVDQQLINVEPPPPSPEYYNSEIRDINQKDADVFLPPDPPVGPNADFWEKWAEVNKEELAKLEWSWKEEIPDENCKNYVPFNDSKVSLFDLVDLDTLTESSKRQAKEYDERQKSIQEIEDVIEGNNYCFCGNEPLDSIENYCSGLDKLKNEESDIERQEAPVEAHYRKVREDFQRRQEETRLCQRLSEEIKQSQERMDEDEPDELDECCLINEKLAEANDRFEEYLDKRREND